MKPSQAANSRLHLWQVYCPSIGLDRAAEVQASFMESAFHTHGQFQLLVNLEGQITMQVGDRVVALQPMQRFMLSPLVRHRVVVDQCDPIVRFLDIRISSARKTTLSSYAESIAPQPPTSGEPALLDAVLADLRKLPSLPGVSRCAAAFWSLLAAFDEQHTPPEPPAPEVADPRLRQAESLMRENLDRPLSMTELASRIHLSPSHLRQLYVDTFKMPPAQRFRQLRLEHAAHFLANTVLSIQEVGQLCGFTSLTHFSRTFRAVMGEAPSDYRKARLNHR